MKRGTPPKPLPEHWAFVSAKVAGELRWVHIGKGWYLFDNGDLHFVDDLPEAIFQEVFLHGYERVEKVVVVCKVKGKGKND